MTTIRLEEIWDDPPRNGVPTTQGGIDHGDAYEGPTAHDNPMLAAQLKDCADECWRSGMTEADTQARVREHNRAYGSPPLAESEADRIARIPFRTSAGRRAQPGA